MSPLLELSESQRRQYIDAEAVFSAWEQARKDVREVRGSMFWREQSGRRYLIRTSAAGAQKSLGPESARTQEILDKFAVRKVFLEDRVRTLQDALHQQQRLNRAHRVGRVPGIVVGTLNALAAAGLDQHFLTIGTNAMYAYESAAGVRLSAQAMATRDIDLFFDAQKHLRLLSQLQRVDASLLAVLRNADKSFVIRPDQRYTAVNGAGFEVDIVRRPARGRDAHPMPLGAVPDEDTFWAVQVSTGDQVAAASRIDEMVVSATGSMARMKTIGPRDFVRIKRALAASPGREPLKRGKDLEQADLVERLVSEYLIGGGQP